MLGIEEAKKKLLAADYVDGKITEIELIDEKNTEMMPGASLGIVPEHLKVNMICEPEEGSHIKIEIRLPIKDWNGEFFGTGNGGYAGVIVPFVTAMPLQLGFAVANTDMGTSKGPDCGIDNRAVWKDFGYRATHLMTVNGKLAAKALYGSLPKYSYFMGSSTGGQQGIMEAQRYPEDYDGILVNAPAHDRVKLHVGFVWEWLALNASQDTKFTMEEAKKVVDIILDKYGKQGERRGDDPFLYRPDKIVVTRDAFGDSGFSEAQMDALMKVYEGAMNPVTGKRIFPAITLPGSEDGSLPGRCDADTFAFGFFYILRWVLGADFDFRKFDFDKDTARLQEELSQYVDATDADLSKFRDRGGKLMIIHGTADPMIPYTSSIQYFEAVNKKLGNASSFFKLYLAPGMGHTIGGPGVQDIIVGFPATPRDSKHLGILALKEWVENGKEPDELLPVAFQDGSIGNAFAGNEYSFERSMFPYEIES